MQGTNMITRNDTKGRLSYPQNYQYTLYVHALHVMFCPQVYLILCLMYQSDKR